MPPSGSIAPGLSAESTRGSSVGAAVGVDEPGALQPFAFRREALVHRVGRRRAADIDENRIAAGREPCGNRVRRDSRLHAAVRRDAGSGRIGAHQDDDEARVGYRFQIRLQTADVMAPADDDRHNRVREDSMREPRRWPASRASVRAAGVRPTSGRRRDRRRLPDRLTWRAALLLSGRGSRRADRDRACRAPADRLRRAPLPRCARDRAPVRLVRAAP